MHGVTITISCVQQLPRGRFSEKPDGIQRAANFCSSVDRRNVAAGQRALRKTSMVVHRASCAFRHAAQSKDVRVQAAKDYSRKIEHVDFRFTILM